MKKDLLKSIKQCRIDLYSHYKLLNEEGDDRYPKSFIEGIMVGLHHALDAIDATLEIYKEDLTSS